VGNLGAEGADPLRAEEEANISVLKRIVDGKAKVCNGVLHLPMIGVVPPPRV
jgi:hypothetical protein